MEVYTPELVNGVFTVKAATETEPAKTVKFTKGNLFWDGSKFRCEENQYDYPTTREASHVGHLFWSKDARVAYAADYAVANTEFGITPAKDDKFFAADGGAIEGYTVLSYTEWQYLIDNALEKASSKPKVVTVAGKNCVILKSDGFSGTVADSYTAEQWITAEASGLVALPFAGAYDGSSIGSAGIGGRYWLSNPDASTRAIRVLFFSDGAYRSSDDRDSGYSVRLVSVVE